MKANPKGIAVCETINELVEHLPKLLRILGVYVGLNEPLLQQLLRIIQNLFIEREQNAHLKPHADEFVGEYLLPAACIKEDQHHLTDELLWNVLQKMDFRKRYDYYQRLLSRGYLSNYSLLNQFINLHPKCVKWAKSICDEKE